MAGRQKACSKFGMGFFIKMPLEYPSACWRDEKGFAEGEYF
jgi:hypothetical protein